MDIRCAGNWIKITLLVWITWCACCLQGILATYVENKDYCTYEAFEAECPESHVISIQQAIFGRMKSGRCISDDYKMGCQADVTRHLANTCSGRTQCHVMVGTLDSIVQPCDKDLKSYLEASYHCLHVNFAKPCHQRERTVLLTQSSGFISPYDPSAYTADLGIVCPWKIEAQPGQRVNISLVTLFAGDKSDREECPLEVALREEGKPARTFNLCNLDSEMQLYSSKSHVLYVELQGKYGEVIQKLLKYQVHGCPDIKPITGAHIRRDGNTLAVVCNASHVTWYLTCKDYKWVGSAGNCSLADSPESAQPSGGGRQEFSKGITLAIVVGVALGTFMGACMLCLVYLVRKRKRRSRNETITAELQYEPGMRASGEVIGSSHMTTTQIGPQQCQAVICHTKRRDPEITEYTHVWNVHPPSVCNERQYSSSTFNPNYDHSCVTMQPNYDSNTIATAPTTRKPQHSSLRNISGAPLGAKGTGKESQTPVPQQQNIFPKRRSAGNLLEEISDPSNGNNSTGSSGKNNNNSATLGTRTHFCELHGNV